jgi:hypothetical protein
VCQSRQVLTSCIIWYISLVLGVSRVDRFWHPVQSDTFPWECVRLYRMSEPVYSWHTNDQGNVSDCTGCQNLSTLDTPRTRGMCQIVQDVRTCLLLTHQWSGECTGSDILYNLTHSPDHWCVKSRQVLISCTIWHIPLVLGVSEYTGSDILYNLTHSPGPWCVRIYRFWHPVQSDTFPWSLVCQSRQVLTSCPIWHIPLFDQGNVSDCTGCQNLSTLDTQMIRRMCQIVQDVRTCLLWHTKDQGNVSDCTGCQNLSTLDTPMIRGMCQIVQDVRTCILWHTKEKGNVSDCTGC